MLRNSTGFTPRYVGGPNRVQQRGLAVIHVPHDRNYWRTRNGLRSNAFVSRSCFGHIFLRLLLKADHVGVGSEETRHLAGKLRVESLIDGREHTASEQACDQILCTNAEFLREVLYANAFGDGDAARDGLRLARYWK